MPGWQAFIEENELGDQLAVAGIVEEQHPDRAALFMQWKGFEWPLLADPFNDLAISAVPITLLVDEHGTIRYKNPSKADLREFLSQKYDRPGRAQKPELLPKDLEKLFALVGNDPRDARAHFRLGVAYRMRYDAGNGSVDDFAKALRHWQSALDLNPNQYIWRRRIQQYGPRLDKPYSFYDWVNTARTELRNAGKQALPLVAEPSGAEFAHPANGAKDPAAQALPHPDPDGKLKADTAGLVGTRVVVVPSTNRGQKAYRVHLIYLPAEDTTWTNDAGNVSFHLDPDSKIILQDLKIPKLPPAESSAEKRVIEFELVPQKEGKLPDSITGSAFYYVCTKTDATCQFLRQDIKIILKE